MIELHQDALSAEGSGRVTRPRPVLPNAQLNREKAGALVRDLFIAAQFSFQAFENTILAELRVGNARRILLTNVFSRLTTPHG